MLIQLSWLALGAVAGAYLRWSLQLSLNTFFPTLPLGTLACNWIGGFLIGILLELSRHQHLLPEMAKIAIITGFLGSLTTFSTFNAEGIYLLFSAQYLWFFIHVTAHVVGSLLLTIGGAYLMKLILL